jgi:uncharacterized membrane protein
MRGQRDLTLVVLGAIACTLLALAIPVDWIAVLFAAPVALVFPGYAIAALSFARRPLEVPQLLALTVGLSLAVLALGALLLNYVPGGLRAESWAVFLVLLTVAACRGAALRRRPEAARRHQPQARRPRIGAIPAALFTAGAALAVAAIAVSFVAFEGDDAIGYTELWMQPLDSSRESGVRVGIGSDEQRRTSYRLLVHFRAGRDPYSSRFSLDPGESIVRRVPVVSPSAGQRNRVMATLYRADQPGQPYRRVTGWVLPEAGRQ